MNSIRTIGISLFMFVISAYSQLPNTKGLPNMITAKTVGTIYGFGGTGKVLIAVDTDNRDVVITVFDSIDNHVGIAVLSQYELQEVLNQLTTVVAEWNQNHGRNQNWNYTTAKIDPQCSLGCLTIDIDEFGTSVGTSVADPKQTKHAISEGRNPNILSDMVKFLDPISKVLTGTWVPPTTRIMTKQERKAAAKAEKEAQKREEAAENQRVIARCYQMSRIPISQLSESDLRSLESCRYLGYIR
jgi:hypothetical protein